MRSVQRLSVVTAMLLATTLTLTATGCRVMHHKETTGQYVDDTTLKARAKAALIRDKDVNSSDIGIDVYQGHVTLSGVARNSQEVRRAEQDIKKVDGVKSVDNNIRVAQSER